MHPNMLKAMKAKKKRAVDPNAPPRPNLLTHDKQIRDMDVAHRGEIAELRRHVYDLERKLARQTNYLDALHRQVVLKK
jgi:polyhydroxyalkanoate synthesis regulator phasin